MRAFWKVSSFKLPEWQKSFAILEHLHFKILLLLLSLQIHFCKVPESVNGEESIRTSAPSTRYSTELHLKENWITKSLLLYVDFWSTMKDFSCWEFSRNEKQLVTCDKERGTFGYKAGREPLKKSLVSHNQEVAIIQFSAILRSSFPLYAHVVFKEMV